MLLVVAVAANAAGWPPNWVKHGPLAQDAAQHNASASANAAASSQPEANSQSQQQAIADLLAQVKQKQGAAAPAGGAVNNNNTNSDSTNNNGNSTTSDDGGDGQAAPMKNASISDQSFANMVRNLMPLSPQQIKTLHYMYDQSRRAAATSPTVPPKPTSSAIQVNLAPGAMPPVVRLSSGFVTSLVFVDATGAPWPIQAYDIGDPKSFNVQWDQKGNTLLVESLSEYKSGNLAVMLKGLNTPVMVTLMPGQRAVDYRVDLRVPGMGPDANASVEGLPDSSNPQLLSVLDGVPPQGSKRMQVLGGDGEAWLEGTHLYLRTRLTVISPGWISVMNSADGMHAYDMTETPVVLASDQGKLVKLTIQGL